MTNEELIDRQICQMCNQRRECIKDNRNRCEDYEDAVELLKEKDQQFKEYLEKKKMEMLDKRRKGEGGVDTYYKRRMVEEIIDELFGETEQDNSDREEYEWLYETWLNKACEWITNMPIEYAEMIDKGHNKWIADDFRKAMMEEGSK